MTSERVKALIHAMVRICDGIPVLEANVVSTPFHKRKVDKEALARNIALVEDSFGVEASFRMDKKTLAGKRCAYGIVTLGQKRNFDAVRVRRSTTVPRSTRYCTGRRTSVIALQSLAS